MGFTKLFEPITINHTTFRNRMVVSAMVTNYCEPDGLPTEKFMAYHEHKAKGGWGIIITEDFAISPTAGSFKRLPGLWQDAQIGPYQEFTERIHRHDGKIIAQIYHAGRETSSSTTGVQCVAPSAIKDPVMREIPRELTKAEIWELEEQFADCARRAQKAGFDGIEIHGAHGYLVNQFVSPFSNKRSDEYGGNLVNRTRFVREMIAKIREKCGADFPVFYRMSSVEYVNGGLCIEEAKAIAMLLEEAGVDCFHVSQGVYGSMNQIIPSHDIPGGYFVDHAAEIKKIVHVPVIAVGRIHDPYLAESIIRSGKADLCTMARASLADPDMPKKIRNGDYEEVLHCIGCMQGCSGENGKGHCIRCLVNPMTGMEDEYDLCEAETAKNVVVVGGGVSGCEAAIVAAQRGHHVTLLEKETKLGGQWKQAAIPVGKSDFASLIVWQRCMLQKYHVDVCLNCEATKAVIDSYKPDAVILATGSQPLLPNIPGLKKHGISSRCILEGTVEVGKKVVVLGGGLVGAETADFIAEHGCKDVTIIDMLPDIAMDGESSPTYFLKKRLSDFRVKVLTSAKVESLTEKEVKYRKDGEELTIEQVDTAVVALGVVSNHSLMEELKDIPYEVITVGDCRMTKNGYLDIREGFEAGLQV